VRFDADLTEWLVVNVGMAHFAVVGARRPAGIETIAVFVCADTLTMSMSCRAQMAAADGEQWFTVLEPDVDVMAVFRRLIE
jgi:hypothetical protein